MPDAASSPAPLVGVIMGSRNDWETMQPAAELLEQLQIPHECRVVSAHRTPAEMMQYASGARQRGLQVIIAGAGGAAHLPGMVASLTTLPVLSSQNPCAPTFVVLAKRSRTLKTASASFRPQKAPSLRCTPFCSA